MISIFTYSYLFVTVNYGFAGKTIPDLFGSLPSLSGLFLGELFIYFVI